MPIEHDLDGLPAADKPEGWPPDRETRFMHSLADEWLAQREHEGPRAKAADTRFRHSDGGNCSRALAYAALELPASNPIDIAGIHVMNQGTLMHDALQAVLNRRFGIQSEITVRIDGFDGSGHADGLLDVTIGAGPDAQRYNPGQRVRTVFEYKFTGGFAFKMAVGERGPARGPKWTAVVQGALNAVALHADELVLGMASFEAISKQIAERKHLTDVQRFCAEWTLTREQFAPIAAAEVERVSGILGLLDQGMLPRRTIPDPELPKRNLITDPTKGTWVEVDADGQMINAGSTWQCAYCRWQDMCTQTGPGRVPVVSLPEPVLRQVAHQYRGDAGV